MKYCSLLLLLFAIGLEDSRAQEITPIGYTNFPVVLSFKFHALALPFKDIKSNLSNVGIALGTEFSWNKKNNLAQSISISWTPNKAVGERIAVNSELMWRPYIVDYIYAGPSLGLGLTHIKQPGNTFELKNGTWTEGGRGKWVFGIPAGITAGYYKPSGSTHISPFVNYNLTLLTNVNKSISIVPETAIQFGSRIHLP